MVELPADEEIEIGREELVLLRYSSSWPAYTIEWTRRHRSSGSQSFPLTSGTVRSTTHPPNWHSIRSEALNQAGVDDRPREEAGDGRQRRSFLSRLLKRS